MNTHELYPLGDPPPRIVPVADRSNVRARWTGAKRSPKTGEWYLSGSIPDAYQAKHDLSTVFHIAELVMTETIPAKLRVLEVIR